MILTGGNVFCVRESLENGSMRHRASFQKKDIYIDERGRFSGEPALRADQAVGQAVDQTVSQAVDNVDKGVIDVGGCYVIPGLVDVHTHGCAGADFSDGDEEGLRKMAAWLLSRGVTSFCPTSMSYPKERLMKVFSTAGSVPDDGKHAQVAGIHMEGPFLSQEKRGAQNPAWLTAPDAEMFASLLDQTRVPVRLVTIAPELPGAVDFTKSFRDRVHISLGHSMADYEQARKVFLEGADHVTHLFNAMMPLGHRSPGLPGAAADLPHVYVELICDGYHIHPAVIRAAFSLYGADRIVLVSDSMRATGLHSGHVEGYGFSGDCPDRKQVGQQKGDTDRKGFPAAESELGGLKVLIQGDRASLADGTLAGSVADLMTCLKRAVSFGIPLEDAVLAASSNPARSIGLEGEIGEIRPGARADLVVLDPDLRIRMIVSGGRKFEIH